MTPRTCSILAVRLIVLFLLIESLSSLGITIYNVALWERNEYGGAVWQLIIPVSYFIILLLLLKFATPIAERVSRGLKAVDVQITWSKTELLSVLIAAICIFFVLSAIPKLVNQLTAILEYNRDMASSMPESARLNRTFLGMVGSFVQVGVAVFVYIKARHFAVLWEKRQSSAASPGAEAAEGAGVNANANTQS